MALSFLEGARRWDNVVDSLDDFVKEQAVIAKRDGIIAVLDYLRDDPVGPLRRKKTDSGPLRIVTSRLWESIRGDTPLRGFRNLPATSRRWQMTAGGRNEHYSYGPRATVMGTLVRAEIRFGSRTPYAHEHEKGHGNIPRRSYFGPGTRKGFALRTRPRLGKALRNHIMSKLR